MSEGRTVSLLAATAFLFSSMSVFALGAAERIDGKGIVGSGRVVTERREISGFTAIELAGSGNVEVRVGREYRVEVTADDNVVGVLTTEVRSRTLFLGVAPGARIVRATKMTYTITLPELSSVAVNGSGNVSVDGIVKGTSFEVTVGGSGSFNGTVDVGRMKSVIRGSGGIHAMGTAEELVADIGGSGSITLRDLHVRAATVKIAGSGDVWVDASETLDVTIAGSGSVHYHGNPRQNVKVAGSGRMLLY